MQTRIPASSPRRRIGVVLLSATLALSLLAISAVPAHAASFSTQVIGPIHTMLVESWSVDYQLTDRDLLGGDKCKDGYPKPPKDKDGYPKPPKDKDKDKCPTPTPQPTPTVRPYP